MLSGHPLNWIELDLMEFSYAIHVIVTNLWNPLLNSRLAHQERPAENPGVY